MAQSIERHNWLRLGSVVPFTPPGGAAALIAGKPSGLPVLLIWAASLISAVRALERRRRPSQTVVSRMPTASTLAGGLVRVFPARVRPFAQNALLFYFRCPRIQMSALIYVPVMFMSMTFSAKARLVPTFSVIATMAAFITHPLSLNQYGYLGQGVRRYALLPLPFSRTLRWTSLAGVAVSALAVGPALAFAFAFRLAPWDVRAAAVVLFASAAAICMSGACGLWTSVWAACPGEYGEVFVNDMAGRVKLVFPLMMMLLFSPMLLLNRTPTAEVLERWWVFAVIAVPFAILYGASLILAGRTAARRREQLIQAVTGG
jgi:hypothetical protein